YSLPPSNAVSTSRSPAMIGEENPGGTGTFQRTFRSGPNSTGGFSPSATAEPPDPRNCGHASRRSSANPTAANTASATHAVSHLMSGPSVVLGIDKGDPSRDREGAVKTAPSRSRLGQSS